MSGIELDVINEVKEMLSHEDSWKQESVFGEICEPNASKFTLGCALEFAQLKIRRKKQNRSKEMRLVRRKIYRHFFWRAGIHPITYFNRHKKTEYKDIIFILDKCKDQLLD